MEIRKLLFVWTLVFLPAMGPWKDCEGATACTLQDRSYHVKLPDDWDGETPLPMLLHFHGWGRQGDLIVKHRRISGATRRRGVLLVAPNGNGRSWDFWGGRSDDVEFAAAVIENVAAHYPIDRKQIYVSGYSYGAAMAWRYACENGNAVAALLAVSGSLRQDEACPQAPREVRHVHGFADNVMGFPMGPGGDETYPVALWRQQFGCGPGQEESAWGAVDFLTFDRRVWTDCVEGHKVTLDLHPGGHFIPHGWIGWQLDQLMGRVPHYP
ncbi:PHB depolymerase family esterase [Sulfitobacter sp. SK011]|uniref:alpha/beta hydrolase family esterase n=1 Tax=Sulfitobacter sp. SK011 TaxID=1389004 RepID=UPI000E0A0D13|nr:PHB depolymerase family esterase [Sulfitobacter sp. SK011]AXI43804.1 polyhydroxybutyrate depolymerase [Sulfitobacter sp. SK011]